MGGVRGIFVLSGACALVLALFALGPIALASHDFPQASSTQPPSTTITSETRAVNVEVSVTDASGKPVAGLSQNDFTLFDSGKPREFQLFSEVKGTAGSASASASAAPAVTPPANILPPNVFTNIGYGPAAPTNHSTVILFDAYNTLWQDTASARPKVASFVREMPANERVAIYVYSKLGLAIVQDFTTNHELAAKGVERFTYPPSSPGAQDGQAIPVGVMRARPTETALATQVGQTSAMNVFQVLGEHLALIPGRKSVIWITAGFREKVLRSYKDQWDKVSATLNNADVAVDPIDAHFCVYPDDCSLLGASGQAIQGMKTIAEWTGGKEFDHRADMDAAMLEAIATSRPNYVLGFYLGSQSDGKYHPLSVKVNRSGLTLHYRQGYYAGPAPELAGEQKRGDLAESLLNPEDSRAVGITAEVVPSAGKPNGTFSLRLNLAPQTIALKENGNGWTGKVDELFVQMNEAGATLSKLSDSKEFQVPRASRAQFDSGGATLPQTLPIATGATKLRIVVRDKTTGHVGTLTITLADVARGGQ